MVGCEPELACSAKLQRQFTPYHGSTLLLSSRSRSIDDNHQAQHVMNKYNGGAATRSHINVSKPQVRATTAISRPAVISGETQPQLPPGLHCNQAPIYGYRP